MRVIVTRPAAQADEWVASLLSHGIDAVALPLIRIEPLADATALRLAWGELPRRRLAMFVSPNAAEHFFAARPVGAGWPAGTLAGSPGPGTSRALAALGVPAAQIVEPAADAPQFDSESLWAELRPRDWQGASALIVRGESGRDWLAERLREVGAEVAELAAYRREGPCFDAAGLGLLREALAEPARHLWLFSSSEAIRHLAAAPEAAGADRRAAQALATHPRIAEAARQAGFGRVIEARPALHAVVACIQSLRS